MKITVINGANINNLHNRGTIYGGISYKLLCDEIKRYCTTKGVAVEFFQSNYEGAIIDALQQCGADGVIINAGAYTHYSYAIRDAIEDCAAPCAEVHLTDITKREDFRNKSVFEDVVEARFFGEGIRSYTRAVDYFVEKFNTKK